MLTHIKQYQQCINMYIYVYILLNMYYLYDIFIYQLYSYRLYKIINQKYVYVQTMFCL